MPNGAWSRFFRRKRLPSTAISIRTKAEQAKEAEIKAGDVLQTISSLSFETSPDEAGGVAVYKDLFSEQPGPKGVDMQLWDRFCSLDSRSLGQKSSGHSRDENFALRKKKNRWNPLVPTVFRHFVPLLVEISGIEPLTS